MMPQKPRMFNHGVLQYFRDHKGSFAIFFRTQEKFWKTHTTTSGEGKMTQVNTNLFARHELWTKQGKTESDWICTKKEQE